MGKTWRDRSLAVQMPPRERTAIVSPAGRVSVFDMPDGAPNVLLLAGERYTKALFQPELGGAYRFVYTQRWPLERASADRLRDALAADDGALRALRC